MFQRTSQWVLGGIDTMGGKWFQNGATRGVKFRGKLAGKVNDSFWGK